MVNTICGTYPNFAVWLIRFLFFTTAFFFVLIFNSISWKSLVSFSATVFCKRVSSQECLWPNDLRQFLQLLHSWNFFYLRFMENSLQKICAHDFYLMLDCLIVGLHIFYKNPKSFTMNLYYHCEIETLFIIWKRVLILSLITPHDTPRLIICFMMLLRNVLMILKEMNFVESVFIL